MSSLVKEYVSSVLGKVFVSGVSLFFQGLSLYLRFLYSRAGEEFVLFHLRILFLLQERLSS